MSFLDGFYNRDEKYKASEKQQHEKPVSGGPALSEEEQRALNQRVVEVLREIYDPEIPVNIYEMGLIYDVIVSETADVTIVMTLTTPHCPVAESMPGEIELKVRDVEGVGNVTVELVWDPPWDMSMMSEAARLEMGFM
ncbi:SUF system Fe-S cluster assembly protein [Emcibacter sp.]|uniref:SUF system Fe-S cluster assembly protein n=1 Tax=Emcibacter sp. TaxID=1979954 RepID=UPI002AA88833|nr:SUF system Fe-S cluster assembly protein [Emcibacter sp.]